MVVWWHLGSSSVLAVWRGSTATVTTASASMAMEYQDIIQDVEQEEYDRTVLPSFSNVQPVKIDVIKFTQFYVTGTV